VVWARGRGRREEGGEGGSGRSSGSPRAGSLRPPGWGCDARSAQAARRPGPFQAFTERPIANWHPIIPGPPPVARVPWGHAQAGERFRGASILQGESPERKRCGSPDFLRLKVGEFMELPGTSDARASEQSSKGRAAGRPRLFFFLRIAGVMGSRKLQDNHLGWVRARRVSTGRLLEQQVRRVQPPLSSPPTPSHSRSNSANHSHCSNSRRYFHAAAVIAGL